MLNWDPLITINTVTTVPKINEASGSFYKVFPMPHPSPEGAWDYLRKPHASLMAYQVKLDEAGWGDGSGSFPDPSDQ